MVKNTVTRNFNYALDQRSPVLSSLMRTVVRDKEGNEVVTYEQPDYLSICHSHGDVSMWSLNALQDAGVNPNFPIHTSSPSRLEGIESLQEFLSRGEALLAELSPEPSSEPTQEPSKTE